MRLFETSRGILASTILDLAVLLFPRSRECRKRVVFLLHVMKIARKRIRLRCDYAAKPRATNRGDRSRRQQAHSPTAPQAAEYRWLAAAGEQFIKGGAREHMIADATKERERKKEDKRTHRNILPAHKQKVNNRKSQTQHN